MNFYTITIIVGFNFPVEHDNAVAVIQDGKLIFATEEERFTRHKHSLSEPPINALLQAFKFLAKQGIKPNDIDAYAINFNPKLYPKRTRDLLYKEMYIISECGQQFHSFEIFTFIITPLSNKYVGV
ncbi:carbamoyltransferase N-terminal domain-containing protein [Saccharolobus islandicus]|uniref:Carbamoyl transferase NodU family-like protein n=1 Tax=Saccharolobus islandicus (strain M.16.4 / Kamchatka \|nr:carbamoyltransferase N-terminal domain-containing protein [Sulfolobus islandicus]ACR41607.1 carbamoyl transferase NodU family-like protein [Sulfolobus islandicus M.16.4]